MSNERKQEETRFPSHHNVVVCQFYWGAETKCNNFGPMVSPGVHVKTTAATTLDILTKVCVHGIPSVIYLWFCFVILYELAGLLVGRVELGPPILGAVPVDET